VDGLLELMGTDPYHLQLGCYYLWEALKARGQLPRPGGTIDIEPGELSELAGGRLEEALFASLSEEQREL
jgi:hypothetical protein